MKRYNKTLIFEYGGTYTSRENADGTTTITGTMYALDENTLDDENGSRRTSSVQATVVKPKSSTKSDKEYFLDNLNQDGYTPVT